MRSARLAVALMMGLAVGVAMPTAQGALIAYWTFDDTLEDSTASSYDGTGNGGWSYSTTVPWINAGGKSLGLNGSNAFVSVNTGSDSLSGTYTVMCWARVADTNPRTMLGTRSPSDTSFDMKLQNGNLVHGDIGSGSGWYLTAADQSLNYSTSRWYHITYVVEPNSYRIYVHDASGSLVAANTTGSFIGSNPLLFDSNHQIAIGAYRVSGGEYFNGQIDDVRIYNNALTQLQAQAAAFAAGPPTGNTGPGGFERTDISSSALYWLNAGSGVAETGGAVSAWNDQTSRGNNFTQGTAANQPQYVAGALNGQPVVRFDGAASPNADQLTLATATAPSTVFMVTSPDQYVWLAGVWGSSSTPSGGDKGIRIDPTSGATAWRHPGDGNDFTNGTGGAMYINGTATNNFGAYGAAHILTAYRGASSPTTYNNTHLGWYYPSGTPSRFYDGDIAEVICYDRPLNSAERIVVENYLSAKYNIALSANDFYSGDTPANGDYDLDVFGIGRVNAANQLLAAGAAGFGIMALNGTLGDGEWVFAGHNTPVNGRSGETWDRVWFVEETGGVDVLMAFDCSDAGLEFIGVEGLMYSATGAPGSFTSIGVQPTVEGDRLSFVLPDALFATGYYTLQVIPEPGTLSLLGLGILGLLTRRGRRGRTSARRKEKRMRTACLTLVGLLALTGLTQAGVITLGPALSTDASTGVSTGVAYTHKIGAGEAVTLNGVSFDLLNPTTTPAKFNWNTYTWNKNSYANNNGGWVPATGGVTGTGVIGLLNDFTFSPNGDQPGSYQTFTLSGLIPGTTYETRLYVRTWSTTGSGRPIQLTFNNGTEIDSRTIQEDRADLEGYPSVHSAYCVNYSFTAQASTMSIDALVVGTASPSGSLHLYALTNQFAGPPTGGTGPGGIEGTSSTSSLLYWLNAGSGVVESGGAVSAWNDQTARGNDFTQATAAKQPQYVTGALNGQPVVRFDGDLTGNSGGVAPNADEVILATTTAPQTVFIVNTLGSGNVGLAGIWGLNDGDYGIRRASSSAWQNPGNSNDFTNPGGSAMYVNGQQYAGNATANEGVPHILTAARASALTWSATSLGDYFRVGNNTPRPYKGDIAEVIVYDRALNSAERIIIENYLSAKYNVGVPDVILGGNKLAANDYYSGDTPTMGDYDLDVFGIGRVDAANQVLAAGSAGLGIMALNDTLGDGEWIFAGHNTPVNGRGGLTWDRVWFVEETGGVDVLMAFDCGDAGLGFIGVESLMYSATGAPGSFTVVGVTPTVEGDRLSFVLPDALFATGYYTLQVVPEPGTLSLLGLGFLGLAARRRRRAR